MWGEKRGWKEVTCIAVQVGEMTSLFVLFARFYKKSYSKKSGKEEKKDDDQCSKAMAEISNSAKEGLRTAAKETNKLVQTANHMVSSQAPSAPKCM